jgi:hypothetical protein
VTTTGIGVFAIGTTTVRVALVTGLRYVVTMTLVGCGATTGRGELTIGLGATTGLGKLTVGCEGIIVFGRLTVGLACGATIGLGANVGLGASIKATEGFGEGATGRT